MKSLWQKSFFQSYIANKSSKTSQIKNGIPVLHLKIKKILFNVNKTFASIFVLPSDCSYEAQGLHMLESQFHKSQSSTGDQSYHEQLYDLE